MKRIGRNTVELTEVEQTFVRQFEEALSDGHSIPDTIAAMKAHPVNAVLDPPISDEFWEYLAS